MGIITEQLNNIIPSIENTDKLYEIFKSIDDYAIPIIRFYMGGGTSLIRTRINEKNKEFNFVSDLYCPPAFLISNYGRANLPYQSMFYACSFPKDNEAPYPRMITLMETSSFYKDIEACGIERNTCSKWTVTETIELIVLPFNENYERPCRDIKEIQVLWDNEIKKGNINIEAKDLIDYMSAEISKETINNTDYFKIANFVNYILYINEKTKNADGIMYPSVPAAGHGFNVAIKKESADKKIAFVGASMCYLAKNKMNAYEMIVNLSTEIGEDGRLKYTPKKIEEEEKKIFEKYANGLDFIN